MASLRSIKNMWRCAGRAGAVATISLMSGTGLLTAAASSDSAESSGSCCTGSVEYVAATASGHSSARREHSVPLHKGEHGSASLAFAAAAPQERKQRVKEIIDTLASLVEHPLEQLITTDVELAPFGMDAYSYHSGVPPDVVVFPSSTVQVSKILAACNARNFPVVARGAGTSLEGHTTTPYRGVCIDLSRMDKIIAVRPDDLDCTVQAGVRWGDLNYHLAPHKLFFAMDPGPGASIGGMAGTGCSGTNAVRYGAMKANVLTMTVVLADGTVIKTGSRARKSTAGYDLTSLFIGSEGTLGIVTEITVKLQHVPEQTAVAVAAFPNIRSASDAVAATMRSGVLMGAVELLDAPMIHAVNAQSGFKYPVTPHVFFKFTGSPAKVADDAKKVEQVAAHYGSANFKWATDAKEQAKLWEARKVALWSASAMDTSRKVATTDVCVPISRLPDLMAAMEERCAKSPLKVYAVAHCGDGNAHHFLAFNPDDPAELAEAKALNSFLVTTAQAMDGTCTGEHGVGVGKIPYIEAEFGKGAIDVMRTLKKAMDPKGILNPGKKIPAA